MSESLLHQIEARLNRETLPVSEANVGTVRVTGDGVAKVEGLGAIRQSEMIEFPGGVMGLAFNLEENEVGVIMLGDASSIKEGDQVRATGKLLSVPVGRSLLGRVVDTLGNPLDEKGPIEAESYYPVEKIASGIISRQSVSEPVQTGIMAIDAMIPIGRGQRELIIGDRGTGKTTIALDTIIAQVETNRLCALGKAPEGAKPLYNVYVAIGQKQSTVARLIKTLEETGAMEFTTVVVASASAPAAMQYLAPYAGCAIAEYLMDQGQDSLIVYDDLSKQAVAYRQVSLVLRRPSGREAYPGDVFYLHSRLLERSARLNKNYGGGSITALPIIETQAGDVSAYIPTNVISITDGQIYLESDLFYQGIRPAINVGLSVSRVGSAAQTKAIKKVAGTVKLDLATFRELQAFSQFGSDLDAQTKAKLERGQRIVELFKQNQHSPIPVAMETSLLFAMQNGFLDAIPVNKVTDYVDKLKAFLSSRKPAILDKITLAKALDDESAAELKSALEEFQYRD